MVKEVEVDHLQEGVEEVALHRQLEEVEEAVEVDQE